MCPKCFSRMMLGLVTVAALLAALGYTYAMGYNIGRDNGIKVGMGISAK